MVSLPKIKNQGGQALILVLLGMAVVLTLVLSVVSTSVTDIDVTTRDEESARALNAAEAGVEEAFLIADNTDGSFDNNSAYTAEVTGIAENATFYNFPQTLATGETSTLWYVSHNGNDLHCASPDFPCVASSNTTLKVCFAPEGTNETDSPAVEISVYYDTTLSGVNFGGFSGTRVMRAVYDPNVQRRQLNGFASASGGNCTLGGAEYEFSTPAFNLQNDLGINCNQPGCLLTVKVRPLYNSAPTTIGFQSGAVLPAQGTQVLSTGTSGDSTRKLEVFRSYKEVPAVFEAAVFSAINLNK